MKAMRRVKKKSFCRDKPNFARTFRRGMREDGKSRQKMGKISEYKRDSSILTKVRNTKWKSGTSGEEKKA